MNTPASRWERRTLGSITSPRKSKGIPNEHGHLPFIGMEHVESHTGRILKHGDSAAYVSAAPLVEPGDVLYGRLRPYLNKVALASERSFVSGEFIPLPGTPVVDSKFLQLRMLAPDFLMFTADLDKGDRPRVSWPQIASFEMLLPPLDEQQRIVAILEDHLSRLDISVQSLRRALSYLDSFRVALYGSAIRGAVGDLHFDVDSWPVATLDELQASGQGSITDGPFGSNLKSSHYTSSGARVIRLQNIGLGHFLDAEAYVSLEHFERLRKHEAIPGDLIVASLGDVLPRVCLLPDLGEPTIVKADCIRVRLGDQVRGRWVLMAMLTQQARQWAREQLHGVGRQRLGLKAIRSFEVPVPPVSVQDEILARVDAVLSWSTSAELALLAALRRSEGLRSSLLSAAFSGQLTRESISV